jgi:hypothetical protein
VAGDSLKPDYFTFTGAAFCLGIGHKFVPSELLILSVGDNQKNHASRAVNKEFAQ